MGGISGAGLISGIDTQSLVNQLIAVASRPQQLAQQRLVQLQTQQAAYLDINSRLLAVKTAAGRFRVDRLFQTKTATTTNADVLTATAARSAQPGNYSFTVDRLVTTQQLLTKGFTDRTESPFGAESFTFETEAARLDADRSLSDLNAGDGIRRGVVRVTDTNNQTADVDLSRAATVSEVLDAFNSAGLSVTASTSGGSFVLTGVTAVADVGTVGTAESLGLTGTGATLSGGTLTGRSVFTLSTGTSLTALNDGNGVDIGTDFSSDNSRFDFEIRVSNADGSDEKSVRVNLAALQVRNTETNTFEVSEPAATTLEDVIERINTGIERAYGEGFTGLSVAVNSATGALQLNVADGLRIDSVVSRSGQSTAEDLGLANIAEATGLSGARAVSGERVLSGLGSKLVRNLNGGDGVGGDGVLNFSFADTSIGTVSVDIDTLGANGDIESLIERLNASAALTNRARFSLNDAGTGLQVTDLTTGSGNLTITGTTGSDTAASLGISTGSSGVSGGTAVGRSGQLRYLSNATRLATLNGGRGVGTGEFRITDQRGGTVTVNIGEDSLTVGDVLREINSRGLGVEARINENGDGIEIVKRAGQDGSVAIRVEDANGTVARSLNIAGTAEGTGDENRIDGSFERTVEFEASDTLQDAVTKINEANAGVRVSIINDGAGSRPFRLSIVSANTGRAGRVTIDTGGFDLGLDTLDRGEDARVFFGSSDPARAVLLTSSSNRLDSAISGVSIDLKATSEEPVQLSVQQDTRGIETAIQTLVSSVNTALDRIDQQTRFVQETNERGPLLGDTTALGLRSAVISTVLGRNRGFSESFDSLTQVGITVGEGSRLTFDADRFRQALAEDPAAVEALFTRRTVDRQGGRVTLDGDIEVRDPDANETFSELSVVARLEQLADGYTASLDGVLKRRNDALDTQIGSQRSRIESLQVGLDNQRARLEAQFVAMEQALAQIQSQQTAISSISRIG